MAYRGIFLGVLYSILLSFVNSVAQGNRFVKFPLCFFIPVGNGNFSECKRQVVQLPSPLRETAECLKRLGFVARCNSIPREK